MEQVVAGARRRRRRPRRHRPLRRRRRSGTASSARSVGVGGSPRLAPGEAGLGAYSRRCAPGHARTANADHHALGSLRHRGRVQNYPIELNSSPVLGAAPSRTSLTRGANPPSGSPFAPARSHCRTRAPAAASARRWWARHSARPRAPTKFATPRTAANGTPRDAHAVATPCASRCSTSTPASRAIRAARCVIDGDREGRRHRAAGERPAPQERRSSDRSGLERDRHRLRKLRSSPTSDAGSTRRSRRGYDHLADADEPCRRVRAARANEHDRSRRAARRGASPRPTAAAGSPMPATRATTRTTTRPPTAPATVALRASPSAAGDGASSGSKAARMRTSVTTRRRLYLRPAAALSAVACPAPCVPRPSLPRLGRTTTVDQASMRLGPLATAILLATLAAPAVGCTGTVSDPARSGRRRAVHDERHRHRRAHRRPAGGPGPRRAPGSSASPHLVDPGRASNHRRCGRPAGARDVRQPRRAGRREARPPPRPPPGSSWSMWGPSRSRSSGHETHLVPRQLPDVTDVVSGVVYARAADSALFPSSARYLVHVSGGP